MFHQCLFLLSTVLISVTNAVSPMMPPIHPILPMKSPLQTMLDACVSNITQSIDVIVDIASARPPMPSPWMPFIRGVDPLSYGDGSWALYQRPMKQPYNPLADEISGFVEAISRSIPKDNFYVVVFDGIGENQTRGYLNIPAQTVTTTTPGFPWGRPKPRPTPTIATVLLQVLNERAYGPLPQYIPTSKDSSAPKTAFSVIITDGRQETPLSAYPSSSSSIVIDLNGNFVLVNDKYSERNVLFTREPEDLQALIDTVRYQICQIAGSR